MRRNLCAHNKKCLNINKRGSGGAGWWGVGAGVACVCTANETENEAKLGERVRERDSTGIVAAAVSGKLRG